MPTGVLAAESIVVGIVKTVTAGASMRPIEGRGFFRRLTITPAQMAQIRAIYQLRATLTRNTGVLYHVDHHIPLSKGGLHVPENLWVITADENLRKGARLPA